MKHLRMVALSLITCTAMVLSACGPTTIQYKVPALNAADQARLTCSDYPSFEAMLTELPAHEWLRTSSGEVVVTPDGRRWVSFDVVQQREARMLKFGGVDASGAHFECFDNLKWISDVWRDLEE